MPESVTDRPTKSHEQVFLLTKEPRYFFDQEAVREEISPYNNGTVAVKEMDGYRSLKDGHDNSRTQAKRTYEVIKGANIRTVWSIATQPYPEAHFATFPEALVDRIIRAGTSERGCCPVCGAPWERVIEVTRDAENLKRFDGYRPRWDTDYEGKAAQEDSPYTRSASGMYADTLSKRRETIDWRPTCECYIEPPPEDGPEPCPCTVLDPFIGSGTTALVARRLGRKTIGIELNPDYCQLAARRLQQLSLLADA